LPGRGCRGFGIWNRTLRRLVDLLVVLVPAFLAEALEEGAEADGLEEARVAEREPERDHQLGIGSPVLDLDALSLEGLELFRRIGPVAYLRLELPMLPRGSAWGR
jgi:hypothetical protein